MKKISFWAAAHPALARAVIGCGHILLIINALWLGFLLYAFEVKVSAALTWGLALLFAAAFLLYPEKGTKYYAFFWRKTADFVLIITHFFALSGYFNDYLFSEDKIRRLAAQNTVLFVPAANRVREIPDRLPDFFDQARQLRKERRAALLLLREEIKPISPAWKILLIALTVSAAVWIALLVTLLGCHIVCSGYEGLGSAIMILGWVGAVFLAFWLIRLIVRRPTKRKQKPVEVKAADNE